MTTAMSRPNTRWFDFKIIDTVRPDPFLPPCRGLDVLQYFLESGDFEKYRSACRWTTYDLSSQMKPGGGGTSRQLEIKTVERIDDALRRAVLGHGGVGDIMTRWREENRIRLEETHRLKGSRPRYSPWSRERLQKFLSAGPPLVTPMNPVHRDPLDFHGVLLRAEPEYQPRTQAGRPRRWPWRTYIVVGLEGSRWDQPAAIQQRGEAIESVLDRTDGYLNVLRGGSGLLVENMMVDEKYAPCVVRRGHMTDCCDSARASGGVKHLGRMCASDEVLAGPFDTHDRALRHLLSLEAAK